MNEIKINVVRTAINVPTRTLKTDEDGLVGVVLPNGDKVRMTVAQMCGVSDEPVVVVKDPSVDEMLLQALVEEISLDEAVKDISNEMHRRTS